MASDSELTRQESLLATAMLVVPMALDNVRTAAGVNGVPADAQRLMEQAEGLLNQFLVAVHKAEEEAGNKQF